VTTKSFFREPFKKKRCLMPVSGYYEWDDTPGGARSWLTGRHLVRLGVQSPPRLAPLTRCS
jgi:putative SOS response-associated peptidase YedK